MVGLEVVDVSKAYGDVQALRGLSLTVAPAEIVGVLGPSGCGKSTLLSIVAGLEEPDQGDVLWEGRSILGAPPHQRGFGLMFQDFALFPHMNVSANVAFGLHMAGMDSEGIRQRTAEMLALIGLPDYGERDISTLSGGEAQRVALARALAPRPQLLMLDEPLGSLDRSLRERLMADLRSILRSIEQTAIYVTHDQEEAFSLADRVVLMNAGRAIQTGTPEEIYHRPASPFVARFLGLRNLLAGEAYFDGDQLRIRTSAGDFPGLVSGPGPVTILIRPDRARLDGTGEVRFEGVVLERTFRGDQNRLLVKVKEDRLSFDFPSSLSVPGPGESISLSLDAADGLHLWED